MLLINVYSGPRQTSETKKGELYICLSFHSKIVDDEICVASKNDDIYDSPKSAE